MFFEHHQGRCIRPGKPGRCGGLFYFWALCSALESRIPATRPRAPGGNGGIRKNSTAGRAGALHRFKGRVKSKGRTGNARRRYTGIVISRRTRNRQRRVPERLRRYRIKIFSMRDRARALLAAAGSGCADHQPPAKPPEHYPSRADELDRDAVQCGEEK